LRLVNAELLHAIIELGFATAITQFGDDSDWDSSDDDDEIVPETDQEDSQCLNGAETEDDETNEETQANEPDIANNPMI